MNFLIFCTIAHISTSTIIKEEKLKFCEELSCNYEPMIKVCGLRFESEVRLKLFDSECHLLKYGCSVSDEEAYGLVRLELCEESLNEIQLSSTNDNNRTNICPDIDCSYPGDDAVVCAIRKYETGYKVRMFKNKCEMYKHNCINNITFTVTEKFICEGNPNSNIVSINPITNTNHIILINGSMLLPGNNYNETIEDFFTATHITDIPLEEANSEILNEIDDKEQNRRGLHLNIVKPKKLFIPWIFRPSVIQNDSWHLPLINTCFHKCPEKCPDTYAPLCGYSSTSAREPSIIFRNHCFMDAAHCKVFWEDVSNTAPFANYLPATFVFCMGRLYGSFFRFMPIIRSLQRMKRLRKKNDFKYLVKHFRNFYNLLPHALNARG